MGDLFFLNKQYEPPTAMHPNYWSMAAMGGVVGGGSSQRRRGNMTLPNSVPFSIEDRKNAWYYYRQFTVVSSAVHQFITEVMKGSFGVTVRVSGKEYRFAPESNLQDAQRDRSKRQRGVERDSEGRSLDTMRYYTEVMMPAVKQIIFEWVMFGYARVRILQPRKSDAYGFPMFTPVREDLTQEVIQWKSERRKYRMFYAGTFRGEGTGQLVPNAHVLVMDAPMDNGSLSSRLARVFGPLAQIRQIWYNYVDSTYYNAHPPYVITPEHDKNRQRAEEALRMTEAAEAAIEGDSEARRKYRMYVLREDAEEDRMRSIHSNPDAALTPAGRKAYQNASLIPRSNPSLYMQGADGGGGGSPLDALASLASQHVEEPWMNGITLPRGHRLNSVPTARPPDQFLPVIEHLYHQVVRSIGIPPGMLEGGANQRHAASVEMGNKELADNIINFHQQAESLLRNFFQRLFQDMIDRDIVNSAVDANRADDSEYLRAQRDAVEVDVKFRYNPIITLESLILLHQEGIITSEAKRDVGLLLHGMPSDYGEPDPDKALAERQEQMTTADSQGKVVLEQAKQKARTDAATSNSSAASKKRKRSVTSSSSK